MSTETPSGEGAETLPLADQYHFIESRLSWAEDSVNDGVRATIPTLKAVLATINSHAALLTQLRELRAANDRMSAALTECANRLQRCIAHSGSDKESAALAVEGYRDIVRDVAALRARGV